MIVYLTYEHLELSPDLEAMLDEIARRTPEDQTSNGGTAEDKLRKKFEKLEPESKEQNRDVWAIICKMGNGY